MVCFHDRIFDAKIKKNDDSQKISAQNGDKTVLITEKIAKDFK